MNRFLYSLCSLMLLLNSSLSAQSPSPNIILIIGDDMRYDSFLDSVSFFHTPSINRIAQEGANFTNSFCVYSLCVPARASIMTGLYPHSHGAIDNYSHIKSGTFTIAQCLDSAGYHTAMIGKYDIEIKHQPGWDYWMVTMGHTDYNDPVMQFDTAAKQFYGNTTQIITDSSVNWIAKTDTPFFITIGHQIPHKSIVPLPQYDSIYAGETMPIPADFYKQRTWYPTFLYDKPTYYTDTPRLANDYEKYFEGLLGIEDNVTEIFDTLTKRGILDNTMIIFMSDNGSLYGEHLLAGKGLPYDPSMRVPIFIRYPAWFANNTVSTEITMNTDIAPTIVQAIGKDPSHYFFEGMSLHDLADGAVHRDQMEFENIKVYHAFEDGNTASTPSLRTLRTLHYKYTRYHCTGFAEEFFDLDSDKLETVNHIHDPAYQDLIAAARVTLDSMQAFNKDTLETTIDTLLKPCYLMKASSDFIVPADTLPVIFNPNPLHGNFRMSTLSDSDEPMTLSVYNELGTLLLQKTLPGGKGWVMTELDGSALPEGIYLARIQQGHLLTTKMLLKM